MSPWPWHAFAIDCPAPIDVAATRLAARIGENCDFTGEVRGGVFELEPRRRARDPYTFMHAIAAGRIERQGDHCRVQVNMRLDLPGAVFALAFIGAWGFTFLYQLLALLRAEQDYSLLVVAPAMFVFGWTWVASEFWTEAAKYERALREVFAAP